MTTTLSLLISGDETRAIRQVQWRLDSVFGRRTIPMEYVRDPVTAATTELIVLFPDDVPQEDITAFRRGLGFVDGRLGLDIDPPSATGSSGAVSATVTESFDAPLLGGIPAGFKTSGAVTFGGGGASGPTTIHSDGGTGLTHDLSTTPISVDLPIQPGSLSIALDIGTAETITDDGAGALTGTTGSLPGGGTINYVTGAMTGTTAALAVSSDVDESHTVDASLSPTRAAILDSGATAGVVSLTNNSPKGAGQLAESLSWSFNLQFSADFGLNNNGVTGNQALALDASLPGGLADGRAITMRWAATTDPTTPPTAWGTPVFVGATPAESPTAALAVDIDSTYHEIVVRLISSRVIGVAYDGVEETFTFDSDIVVPTGATLSHTWGDDLDRSLNVDDWSLSYTLL